MCGCGWVGVCVCVHVCICVFVQKLLFWQQRCSCSGLSHRVSYIYLPRPCTLLICINFKLAQCEAVSYPWLIPHVIELFIISLLPLICYNNGKGFNERQL